VTSDEAASARDEHGLSSVNHVDEPPPCFPLRMLSPRDPP
jgi:hypothetical protein